MQRYRNNIAIGFVFFCFTGWVYDAQVKAASSDDVADRVESTAPATAANPAKSIFAPPSVPPSVPPSAPPSAQPSAAPAAASAAPGAASFPDEGQPIQMNSFGQIDLHVKDQPLTQVLQLLSIQAQRNIVAGKSVTGNISADLYGLDFYQAMDAVLQPNGYGYRESGNVIQVYTLAELKAQKEAERKVIVRIVRLNYINAEDAQTIVTPLLSSQGKITFTKAAAAGFQPTVNDGGANTYAMSDALVLQDYPENLDQVADVLKQLDVRPKQVLIEATVLEAKLTENNAWGVNLTVLADFGFGDITGGPLNAIKSIKDGTTAGTGGAVGMPNIISGQESSFQVGILGDDVAAFIEALDKVTDTTILANPKLLVLNRQKADLLVGQRLGYISTQQSATSTTQTVEFLETGTQLTLRPFISDDQMVRLEIRPSISTGEVKQVATFVVPNEDTQTLTTNVMVRSGQTVVLGGLFKETTTVTRKQVPGVGDIPVLGAAFKGQSDTATRDEFIFLLTPTVIKDEALYAAGQRSQQNAELANIGARQGLLPWSRTRMTSAHVADAVKYAQQGQKDKALCSLDMALAMDPHYVEARRLRDELFGQKPHYSSMSMIQDAIDQMAPAVPAAPAACPDSASENQ